MYHVLVGSGLWKKFSCGKKTNDESVSSYSRPALAGREQEETALSFSSWRDFQMLVASPQIPDE